MPQLAPSRTTRTGRRPASTLADSADPYLRAEGLWGIERYKEANDQFRDVVKARSQECGISRALGPAVPGALRSGGSRETCFTEALEIDKNNAGAYAGPGAGGGARTTTARRVEYAQKAAEARSEAFGSAGAAGVSGARRQRPKAPPRKPTRRSTISPEALDAMAIHATIDLLNDKERIALDGSRS